MASPDIAAVSLGRFASKASADDSSKSPGAQALARYCGKGPKPGLREIAINPLPTGFTFQWLKHHQEQREAQFIL